GAGCGGADIDGGLLPAGDALLAPQLGALELLGCRILVFDDEFDFFTRRDFDLGRLEFMVFDDQRVGWILCHRRSGRAEDQGKHEEAETRHRGPLESLVMSLCRGMRLNRRLKLHIRTTRTSLLNSCDNPAQTPVIDGFAEAYGGTWALFPPRPRKRGTQSGATSAVPRHLGPPPALRFRGGDEKEGWVPCVWFIPIGS